MSAKDSDVLSHHSIPPVGTKQPDLENVPSGIADRIVGMWRVEAMLSGYAYVFRQRDWLRNALDDATTSDKLARFDEIRAAALSFSRNYHGEVGAIDINFSVSATDSDCHRLACEAAVVYLQRALELLPKPEKWWKKHFPLIYCIRRLRHVIVHRRQLDVSKRDFTAQSTELQRDGTPLRISYRGTWFFDVKGEDLGDKNHPIDPAVAKWFQEQCEKVPAWWILQAAVEYVCAHYDKKRS